MNTVAEHYTVTPPALVIPAIRTVGLTKRFKRRAAVNNVTLDVQPGDVFGLLGPNGAGKTTIIRMLLGLVTPTAGRAEIFGYDVAHQKAETARRTAAIIENPALYPMLTGRDNVRAMAKLVRITDANKIEYVVNVLGLGERANDKVKTYSLGMKQRLSIASTLLADPNLIILDEPTNGLDPAGMSEIRAFIRQLAAQGRTVFLSSHLLNEVQQVCNRVAVLQRGEVVAQGLVSDLLSGRTAIQIWVSDAERERAHAILNEKEWKDRVRADGEYLVVDAPTGDGAAINRVLAAAGIYAGEIVPQSMSLEEYYLRLTNAQPTLSA